MPATDSKSSASRALGAVRIAVAQARPAIAYTIGTLVDDRDRYEAMRATFEAGARRLEKLERLLKPRLEPLAKLRRPNALLLAFSGILLMAPFGFVPFSNTAPAIAAILLALGMLHRDGAFVLAGYASIALTLVYFAALIGAAIYGGMELGAALG